MLTHELVILIINTLLIAFAYIWLYPRVVGDDIKKILNYDLLTSMVSILIAGYFYMGSGVVFEMFGSQTDWFWFALVSFFIIEIPFALWYFKKYDMWNKM
jgi:TRAP-type uncharacterized transport system fused permease subunit